MDEGFHDAPRRENPDTRAVRNGTIDVHARHRLADDAARERRRREVRLAGAHDDRRQSERPAVNETLARVIGDEIFVDDFLRAVGGLRRGSRRIVEYAWKLSSEGGEGAREDELRWRGKVAAGFEERAAAIEVHAIAEVEIGLGAAAHDRGEVIDARRVLAEGFLDYGGGSDVARHALEWIPGRCRRCGARDDTRERDVKERDLGVGMALGEARGEARADEAATAGNEDLHLRAPRSP